MRRRLCSPATVVLLLAAAIGLAACGSTAQSRFYTLSSLAVSGELHHAPAGKQRQIIGIGPIALAKYLDHPAITTRSGANTLHRAELDRWGGSLADEVSRVLVENMRQLLSDEGYLVLPWLETAAVNYRVQLNITRFEATPEGRVELNAAWLLHGQEGNIPLSSGDAAFVEPVQGEGYPAISAAMSRALAELSRRIAVEIANRG